MLNFKTRVLSFGICALLLFCYLCFDICHYSFAQDADLEFTLDIAANATNLPKIFKPNIDLSGRGYNPNPFWPQGLASQEVLDKWKDDIGFSGMYRIQYNLWEINRFIKDKEAEQQLLGNYERLIKTITDAGGIVILDIFGMPAGLGKILDSKSPPKDLKAFKELIKNHIRNLSCSKRYNIWYEVWSAPDLEDFFLGRRQDYFCLYRLVAESVKELEAETKIHIPLGAPGVSWWFQNVDGNTVVTPEKSLIYELIRFCYAHRLPLDFISWHGYSTSPNIEQEVTGYKKNAAGLIRDWLSYFSFDRNIPLIVDEWNFDDGANVSAYRKEKSFVCASYILSRLKNMYKAGIDYQLYFCLEDFYNKNEGVVRNTGIFRFEPDNGEYKGGHKSIYNVFRYLSNLGDYLLSPVTKVNDEFIGVIATKKNDGEIAILVYNYIDPDTARNYLSNNIASLSDAERKLFLRLIRAGKIERIIRRQLSAAGLRLRNKVEALLKKAQELNDRAERFKNSARNVKIILKNLEGHYSYRRFVLDSSCGLSCEFAPAQEKKADAADLKEQALVVAPYSVNMIVLKKSQKEPQTIPAPILEQHATSVIAQEQKKETLPEAAAVEADTQRQTQEKLIDNRQD